MTTPTSSRLGRDEEPIAALASGAGSAGLAVIRLSGKNVHQLLNRCLGLEDKPFHSWEERRLYLCKYVDVEAVTLDQPLAVRFAAPRSFTGQDAAEIYCHGSPYIVQSVLSDLYGRGFRPAEPGEFTRRAFLNGKLDLTAAEGIRELVEAQSHQQWLAARQLATGTLARTIEDLRGKLIDAMAYLEAQIDFPDEGDTAHLHLGEVRSRVGQVKDAVLRLQSTYNSGRVASRGLMVALFGEPNVGKSTLMNTLLGKERAIVTAIAGTTRDYLEESCLINGRLIRLVDMAGIRSEQEVADEVERLGVERAIDLAKEADVMLFLASADSEASKVAELEARVKNLKPQSVLRILTKADLGKPAWAKQFLALSCKTGAGLEELRKLLASKVDGYVGELREETFVTSARHMAALTDTLKALNDFAAADARGEYEECLAFELQNAAKALHAIVGEVGNEDVLDRIFGEFCIGK